MSQPCRKYRARLIGLMVGTLSPKDREKVRLHLCECSSCKQALERLQGLSELCRSIGQEPPPNLPWRQIEAQIHWKLSQHEHKKGASRRTAWRRMVWRMAPAAAALSIAVLSGAILGHFLFGKSPIPPRSMEAAFSRPIPRRAPLRNEELAAMITLLHGDVRLEGSDGEELPLSISRPLLQKDSVLTRQGQVALQWTEKSGLLLFESSKVELRRLLALDQELVLSRGKMWIHAERQREEQAFSVSAHGFRASVRGTFFSIAVDESQIEVEVFEGLVVLESELLNLPPREIAAGQSVRYSFDEAARPALLSSLSSMEPSLLNLQRWTTFQRVMAATGVLVVESQPPRTDVKIDSLLLGQTPLTFRTPLGRHLLELWRDGKLLKQQWVVVQPIPKTFAFDLRLQLGVPRPSRLPDGFQELLRRHSTQVRACYERQLKGNPTLAGKLTLRLAIDAEGRVQNVSLANDTFTDPWVGQCALSAAQRWTFPPGNEVELVYPFIFRPE
jgi:hypothetical protein